MKCPRCNSATKVTDGRQRMTGWKRTRKCIECGFKVRTTEVYAEHPSQTPLMTRSEENIQRISEENIQRIKKQAEKLKIKLMED